MVQRYGFTSPLGTASLLLALVGAGFAQACTRVLYRGAQGTVITARSMDWKVDVGTNLWILPRGAQRSGSTGPKTLHWQSKYGSVVATGYDVSTTDGLNEKGLAVNLLWLAESKYPHFDGSRPGLSISLWAQYMLDNYATVAEAVAAMERQPLLVATDQVPGEERLANLHMSMSDSTGDSAVVEYVDGRQVIHHGPQFQVMTNSPTYDQQLALDSYWKEIGGTVMLPGTNRAADRFARASFYVNAIPKFDDPDTAVASVFSVVRNASVPFGITTPDQPNISSTRWRTVADQKRLVYFFESALTPNVFWVDLKQVDFSQATGKVMKLDLGKDQRNTYAGNAAKDFVPARPFVFLGLPDR